MNIPFCLNMMGKPGVGKSTLAKWLANRFEVPLIDTGEVLRGVFRKNQIANQEISSGKLISSEDCLSYLDQEMQNRKLSSGFVLVGFPRNLEQKSYYLELTRIWNIKKTLYLILDYPDDISRARANARREKQLKTGKLRDDDSKEVFERRLKVFYEETNPLLQDILENGSQSKIHLSDYKTKKREILELVKNFKL